MLKSVEAVAGGIRVGRTLQFELRRFGPERISELEESLRAGRAPPSDWYTDRDVFEGERALLRKSWHYAAHVDELKKVGDQIVQKIVGVPIVLLRNEQNEIRGFVNICRHRAHLVVLENQNQRSMQCLYHGWTYGLDGCLRAAPRSRTDPSFDESNFPMLKVQVHQWGPTLWVNIDLDAPRFDAFAEGLPALVEKQGVKMGDYRYSFDKTWTVKANWKVFLDTAIERSRRAMDHHWILPTTFLQFAGDLQGYDIGSVRVLDVDKIEFKTIFFVRNDMPKNTEDRRRHSYEQDPLVDEDVGICERVQDAHAAAFVPPGRLRPGSEWLLLHFRQALLGMTAEKHHAQT
jgi:phenylpropionate dioxygenase-like ring-hydroxylating dioxygenase large terminal subunit